MSWRLRFVCVWHCIVFVRKHPANQMEGFGSHKFQYRFKICWRENVDCLPCENISSAVFRYLLFFFSSRFVSTSFDLPIHCFQPNVLSLSTAHCSYIKWWRNVQTVYVCQQFRYKLESAIFHSISNTDHFKNTNSNVWPTRKKKLDANPDK